MGNYNKYPEIKINNFKDEVWAGYESILKVIKDLSCKNSKTVIALDCYFGVRYEELLNGLIKGLNASLVIFSDDLAYEASKIDNMIKRNMTDDRVFGVMSCHKLIEFFDFSKIENVKNQIDNKESGLIIIYGVGASLVYNPDILIYADLARWEIQQRFRSKELSNWKCENFDEDILKKYKRGFFFEWRVADRHKKTLFERIDFLLDTNLKDDPKMITGKCFRYAMEKAIQGPFRLVPYFDPGVWGGQWMKKVCHLDEKKENFAWSFDGVPEENSIYFNINGTRIEIPAIDLVFRHPVLLLGDKVHARFGAEFPIRFDFLDTMEGQNLSLQVHPLTEYIQENFGMHYTQDESYYILDAKEEAYIYLGVKEGIDKDEMIKDLKRAEKGLMPFQDEKYINKFKVKKHDHALIPAGTIHCSGKNTMVLEISATPYIFTFKLWDWNRLGLDGLPRPVHIEHGEKVIQWQRDTKWVEKNLLNRVDIIETGDGFRIEKTGLHEREFIETVRHWFYKPVLHKTNGSVNVLNLVEGEEAIIESPTNSFEPFIVHYAETFIIPECVNEYIIRPHGPSEGKTIATIKAFVRV